MKIKLILIPFFLILFFQSCARFRFEERHPEIIFSASTETGEMDFPVQSGVLVGVPRKIARVDNLNILSSPEGGEIYIFEKDTLSRIIRGSSAPDTEKTPSVPVVSSPPLHIPGETIAGKNKNFFVLNYIPAGSSEEESQSGFYRILEYSLSGELLHVIGRSGQSELAFDKVLWFDLDRKGRLWVLHLYLDRLYLDRYEDGVQEVSVSAQDCRTHLYGENTAQTEETKECELMYPFPEGNDILLSGRTEKKGKTENESSRFQFRTFAHLDLEKNTVKMISQEWNDPDDFPLPSISEKTMILWQMQNKQRARISFYDLSGHLKNNYRIDFIGHPQQWRSTYTTLSGKIYSVKVSPGRIESVEWK